MTVKQSEKPIANPIVVLREEFDDWAVLFNPDTADAVGINPVGVATWKLMDGNRSVDEIVDEIRKRFSEVPDAAPDEITAFIKDLTNQGFVGHEIEV
jgi:SynChlorMet cassette protein ScmD